MIYLWKTKRKNGVILYSETPPPNGDKGGGGGNGGGGGIGFTGWFDELLKIIFNIE